MIRVGTDKRQARSAELLLDGLVKCMAEKDFTQVSVSDLQRASGVSRATFYRLFDNVADVLDYQCRRMAVEIPERYLSVPAEGREPFLLFTLRYWLAHSRVLGAIFSSGRTDILQKALAENSDYLRSQLPAGAFETDALDYLVAASTGMLSGILVTWAAHGKQESAEELVAVFRDLGEIAPKMLG